MWSPEGSASGSCCLLQYGLWIWIHDYGNIIRAARACCKAQNWASLSKGGLQSLTSLCWWCHDTSFTPEFITSPPQKSLLPQKLCPSKLLMKFAFQILKSNFLLYCNKDISNGGTHSLIILNLLASIKQKIWFSCVLKMSFWILVLICALVVINL